MHSKLEKNSNSKTNNMTTEQLDHVPDITRPRRDIKLILMSNQSSLVRQRDTFEMNLPEELENDIREYLAYRFGSLKKVDISRIKIKVWQ